MPITSQTKKQFYIQGYKLDDKKILQTFPKEGKEPDDDAYVRSFYWPIIDNIPETAYKYVGSGAEPDGSTNLVLVVNCGYDEGRMKESGLMPHETLPLQALDVLTPGIWPSRDEDTEEIYGEQPPASDVAALSQDTWIKKQAGHCKDNVCTVCGQSCACATSPLFQ